MATRDAHRPTRAFHVAAFAILILLCSLTFLKSSLDIKLHTHKLRGSSRVVFTQTAPSLSPPPPNITIIAVWNPKTNARPQAYLPNYFASIRANPQIHVLFVVYDKFKYGCDNPIAPIAENIQEICFDIEGYWRLHADYLCQHWGCLAGEKEVLLQTLIKRSDGDWVNSYFRPFRAGIFSKWIHPESPIWGWCDMDIMLGSFDRKFPWDVADQFDLILPATPTNLGQTMLVMGGHLMFFRHEKRVMAEFFNFHALRSLQTFLDAPDRWIDPGAEEVDYSHFAFLNANLTFMHLHGLVWTEDHLSTAGDGVYAVEHTSDLHLPSSHPLPTDTAVRAHLSSVIASRRAWKPPPSFSSEGMEYVVKLYDGTHKNEAWFPKEFIVHYESDYNDQAFKRLRNDIARRFVMRRAINGPVTERLEPADDILTFPLDDPNGTKGVYNRDNRPILVEYLYVHYQHEKYTLRWPEQPLKKGEVLYMNRNRGTQVWDEKGEPQWSHWTDDKKPSPAS